MFLRAVILVLGPLLLVGGSYCLTIGRHAAQASEAREASPPAEFDPGELEKRIEDGLSEPARAEADSRDIALKCDERARELSRHLNESHRIIVRPPFVLAGDLPESSLDRHYRATIVPTVKALSLVYFDHRPHEAITILLFSSERAYRDAAHRLDRRTGTSYYGYYIRTERRIVLNIGTGDGTLAHELTHALGHFDFPKMPEWFDEGLAAVYEEAEFSEDGLKLVGVSNWRLNHLLHAMQNKQLRTLESLITAREIRPERQAVDYAHARYFCLYLQERGVLPFYYRRFKRNSSTDPSGLRTLCEVFDTTTVDSIDREFRTWVIDLYKDIRDSRANAARAGR